MDIDIDFNDRNKILDVIQHIPASIIENNNIKKHNTGIYCQKIPTNPLTGQSSIDYKEAEKRGYFKIDFLNVGVYKNVRNEEHLIQLMEIEPLWDLLEQDEFTNLLFHLNGHGNILRTLKPKNVEQLAAVLAIIRPAKRHLLHKPWDQILKEIWIRPDNEDYYFKKSHAISYAVAVMVQMNLICEQLSYEYS
jgi:DNA polymerase III alpha subunit